MPYFDLLSSQTFLRAPLRREIAFVASETEAEPRDGM